MRTSICVIIALFYVAVMATVFVQSIPNMCASPDGGNWIVQPLVCK